MTETQPISISQLPVEGIVPAKTNRTIDKEALKELTESIKANGILQPILVRPVNGKHELVYGERRWRAAKDAGLTSVPAMVRDLSDADAAEIRLTENLQRTDLHPLEEAEGYRELHERYRYDVDELAAKVGKSKGYVYARMKLCALVKPARKAFLDGLLTSSTALLVARMPPELQAKATEELTTLGWPKGKLRETPLAFREASDLLQRNYMLRLSEGPFPTAEAELVPAAGPCTTCPKRTGNQRELFDDVKSADVCTDPICFRAKRDAQWSRVQDAPTDHGYAEVLSAKEAKSVLSTHGGGPAYKSGYVSLDERCHGIPWDSKQANKTYRELLRQPVQKGELDVVAGRDRDGNVFEMLREKEAKAALKKLGHLKPKKSAASNGSGAGASTSTSTSSKAKRDPHGDERRRAAAAVAVERIVASVEKRKPEITFWRALARLAWSSARDAGGNLALERRQIPERSFDARVAKAREAELRGLVVEILLSVSLENDGFYPGSSFGGDSYPKDLVDVATLCRVDLKKLEAEAATKLEQSAAPAIEQTPKPKARSKKAK